MLRVRALGLNTISVRALLHLSTRKRDCALRCFCALSCCNVQGFEGLALCGQVLGPVAAW